MYVAEITPKNIRGGFTAAQQVFFIIKPITVIMCKITSKIRTPLSNLVFENTTDINRSWYFYDVFPWKCHCMANLGCDR